MNFYLKHISQRNIWKVFYKGFSRIILIFLVCILVNFLPKPKFICDHGDSMKSGVFNDFVDDSINQTKTISQNVIGFAGGKILRMFPIYSQQNHSVLSDQRNYWMPQTSPSGKSYVSIFRLQNCNFTQFGRTWVNNGDISCEGQTFKTMKKHQKLPDCVRLKVPIGALPTKICVHFPQDDNFISNRLRDMGVWEIEFLSQMEEFFRNNPESQLVDLGCNVGVYTLYAAALSKPVLAIDILPSNLALIQLSIALNDEALEEGNNDRDVEEVLQQLGYRSKTRPKFSELITTLHNAVYSKQAKMYVYLKDDPNLGGTEVKENNEKDSLSDILLNGQKTRRGNETGFMQNNQLADTKRENAKILVDAICLDDLVPYVRSNLSVFLKMDVEGSEPHVLMCANNFFMHVDVRIILMEILFHKYSDAGKTILTFLLRHNMVPSEDAAGHKLLSIDVNNMYSWPENIFWVKVR